jgi:hypothetical protein
MKNKNTKHKFINMKAKKYSKKKLPKKIPQPTVVVDASGNVSKALGIPVVVDASGNVSKALGIPGVMPGVTPGVLPAGTPGVIQASQLQTAENTELTVQKKQPIAGNSELIAGDSQLSAGNTELTLKKAQLSTGNTELTVQNAQLIAVSTCTPPIIRQIRFTVKIIPEWHLFHFMQECIVLFF